MSEQNDKESGILAAIRDYMMSHGGMGGADNREYDIAMGVEPSSDTAKGYAYGGEVTPDLGDVPVPGEAPATPPLSPAAPVSPIPAMMANAQQMGQQSYGQYTPQNRNELYAALLAKQNSMPNAIGNAFASVGDAIARGYGRDNTNFLDKTQQMGRESIQQGLGAFDTAQKGQLAATQAGMEFGKMDPSSQLSKMAQDAYSGPLKKLGYSEADIAKMPASQIESVTQVALKYGDIESQKDLKEATLALTAKMNEAQMANMKSSQEQRGTEVKTQQKRADDEAARSILGAGSPMNPLNPVTFAQKKWAMDQLSGKHDAQYGLPGAAGAGGAAAPAPQIPTFATEADAEKANLPDGTRVSIGGQSGTWRHK